MKHAFAAITLAALCCCSAACVDAADKNAAQAPLNPVIWADVPDVSVLRVGDTYYMTSTTMHMNPGVPVMMSKDLVNWEIVSYCYKTLMEDDLNGDQKDKLTLSNGKSEYGQGTWASSIRYKDGTFYVSSFSNTTGRTYIWACKDPKKGDWKRISTLPHFHDHSLVLDKDGRNYIIYNGGDRRIVELTSDLSGVKQGGVNRVLVSRADTNRDTGLSGDYLLEGSQMHIIDGKYYLINIGWPGGKCRSVFCAKADSIMGPYETKIVYQCEGIAQGGLIDTPDGKWYALLFGDRGGVGRIPFLVPVTWKDGWPMIGTDGDGRTLPPLRINVKHPAIPKCVDSDEFNRKSGDRLLPLVWQWNHVPDNSLWSLNARPGWIRFKTGNVVPDLEKARNTLTQRVFGPTSTAEIKLDVRNMKDGDYAGLTSFQKEWGFVGVKMENGRKSIVMCTPGGRQGAAMNERASVPLNGDVAYLRVEVDVSPVGQPVEAGAKLNVNRKDQSYFYYSRDGRNWTRIGDAIRMPYSLPQHFMGYRFGIFNFATKTAGGYVDVDYFRLGTQLSPGSK